MPRMKIRETARASRIPLLRSLSGSLLIGSRRRSKSRSSEHRTSDQDAAPPVPSIPSTARTNDTTQHTVDAPTPVTSVNPSIAITDVDDPSSHSRPPSASSDHDRHVHTQPSIAAPVMPRKVWVKRPNASATRVEVNSDDLVDNLRDVILLKYANSLGRTIDSPDIILKLVTRDQLHTNNTAGHERALGPEEPVGRTLDDNYPGGQGIDDALIIELSKNRSTPKPSPRPGNHQMSYNGGYFMPVQYRPDEGAPDYFGPVQMQSPQMVQTQNGPIPSMAILAAGQAQPLPSPGGGTGRRRVARPNYARQHTSSPTVMHSSQSGSGLVGEHGNLEFSSPDI
jgi:osomolarity two-component system, response regulator SSK1